VPAAAAPEIGRPFLTFETLTAVPIDLTLVEPSLLSPDERAWLDDYHRWVRTTISPLIEGAAADWLARATRPIASAT
jgi:Xaa-Pro aminopeptidase